MTQLLKEVRLIDDLKFSFKREREKLKKMNFKNKVLYILEYYKLHITLFIVFIFLLASIFKIVLKDEPILSGYLVNVKLSENELEGLVEGFREHSSIGEKSEIFIDDSITIGFDSEENIIGHEYLLKLYAMINSKKLDLMITNKDTLEYFSNLDWYENLDTLLPNDLVKIFKDRFCYSLYDEKEKVPIAIDISETSLIKKLGFKDKVYFLILKNSPNLKNAILFLRYISGN